MISLFHDRLRMKIKYLTPILFLLTAILPLNAEEFKFAAGAPVDSKDKKLIEKNISLLLTEMGKAADANRPLNLSEIDMTNDAEERLVKLWNNVKFRPSQSAIVSKGVKGLNDVQARAIPVKITKNVSVVSMPTVNKINVSVDNEGYITGVTFGVLDRENIMNILTGTVPDIQQRSDMVRWLENYHSYFLERNVGKLADFFCGVDGVEYSLVKKPGGSSEYRQVAGPLKDELNRAVDICHGKDKYSVTLDSASAVMHGAKPGIYGLKFRQKIKNLTTKTTRIDWVFLIWDFSKKGNPVIQYRVWQPDVDEEDECAVNLGDFFMP